MSNKTYKTSRKYKCPCCDQKLPRMDLINHVERKHEALIPEDYTATRLVYDSINKTDHGTCMICKKPVYEWNEKISRYNNLCGSKKCREEVRRIALERHIKVHNTSTLLNDPAHQEKMLSNRHISGSYNHSDGARITYTGKYEKAALEFMDQVMNIPSKDIQMPGPILEYEYNGEKHSWITDIYYIPANLIIEVKDGGSNPNKRNMPEYRGKQYAKEVMITDLGKFNYLRLTDNDFSQLLAALADIKYENMDQKEAPQVKFYINESVRLISIHEEKSELDKNFKDKEKIKLSSLKKIHITEEIINKYKKEYPVLKHVRCKDTSEYICDGYMWMNNEDELVCYVGSCQYTDDHTKWIVSLEIVPKYKGHGLSKQILDYAVKTMKCKYLSVNKNNKVAKHIYDEYGFKTYQEDESMHYMCYGANTVKESTYYILESDFDTPEKLSSWMKRNITYKHTGVFLSAEEVEKNKYGDCHDQSLFEYEKLKDMGYRCGRLFMVEYSSWNAPGGATHTVCYYIDKDKFYWFENAWSNKAGIHGPYRLLDDLKRDIANNWQWSGKNDKLFMKKIGNVKPGMSLEEYVVACTPEDEPKPFATKNDKFKVEKVNEEVGGLPPRRATANWIEPCMVRNTGLETIAIGNDISDTMFVGSMNDELKKITKEEYRKDYERSGESLIYNGDDSTETFKKLMNGVETITEALNIIAKPFRCLDELALRPNWFMMDQKSLAEEWKLIENAIFRENDIVSGAVNLKDNSETILKGAVMLSYVPEKGYFIHTPNDYHLASDYYGGPEDIPQNLIDMMADLLSAWRTASNSTANAPASTSLKQSTISIES